MSVGAVAADIFIRLRWAPERRQAFLESLLNGLRQVRENASAKEVRTGSFRPLADALLKHFEQSFASRNIVRALADAPRGMTEKELERRFTELSTGAGKHALPPGAIRKVIMILMGADFVSLSRGRLQMTELGWRLHDVLQRQRREHPR